MKTAARMPRDFGADQGSSPAPAVGGGAEAGVLDGDRERALADERAWIAGELHHALGQLSAAVLAAIKPCLDSATGVAARRHLRQATEHIEAMRLQVQQTVETLGLLQTRGRTLPTTLRGILRPYAQRLDVDWRMRGRHRPLTPPANSAVAALMVAAATAVGRDPNATTLVVRLNYHATELELLLRSDGARLLRPATETSTATLAHSELHRAERRIVAAGGSMRASTTRNGGLNLIVRMPLPGGSAAATAKATRSRRATKKKATAGGRPCRAATKRK